MDDVGFMQLRRLISLPCVVNQQRKGDPGIFAEPAGVVHITQADRRQPHSPLFKLLLMRAQLRDVLAAEDSTVMPQKRDHRRPLLPQGAQADRVPVCVRQHDGREFLREGHVEFMAERQGFNFSRRCQTRININKTAFRPVFMRLSSTRRFAGSVNWF